MKFPFANYLRFFERARTEWLRAALGLGQRELAAKAGGMFVVSEANVKYRSPARLDDELLISAAVQDAAGATVMIEQSARLRAGGSVLCEGLFRLAWVDAAKMRPARIPQHILEKLH